MRAEILDRWDMKIINQLIDAAEEFIKETKFPVTFNRSIVYERMSDAFFCGDGDIIIAIDEDGNVGGGLVVYAMADYQEEEFGYIEKFFVRAQFRSQGVGRMLAEKAAIWFDRRECLFSFATSTANIGATRLFENLMSKCGYINLGPTLMRENQNGKIRTEAI